MSRALLAVVILASACGRAAVKDTPELPEPQVYFDAVALELEIYEPHDSTTVARPSLLAEVGSPAEVQAEFTLRPARKRVRRLAIEVTPTQISSTTCELDVRSQILDDPRLRIANKPHAQSIPVGEWVDVVSEDMIAARIRCLGGPDAIASLNRPSR